MQLVVVLIIQQRDYFILTYANLYRMKDVIN